MRAIIGKGWFLVLLIMAAGLTAQTVKIEKGSVSLEAVTGQSEEKYKVDLRGSPLRDELNLTQSSRINIEAKVPPEIHADRIHSGQIRAIVFLLPPPS